MKKQLPHLLVLLTVFFAGLTLGFFLGRNTLRGSVTVSVPPQVLTAPTTAAETTAALPEETSVSFPIDINCADEDTLQALPGIGPVLAERIVAYREEHGSFSAAEELLNVEGIGEKRLEAILDYIIVGA